jgi:SulP family sulfate permease
VTGVSGFLTALAIGLIFSCVTFAIRYGQLRAVRSILSVSYKRSRVERGAHERALLAKHGEGIRILILQGYIFFGTAYVVFQQARAVLTAENAARVRALIVDFENVTGIDSSAANSLTKLAVEARRAGATLMWSGLSPADRDLLQRSGIVFDEDGRPRAFRDLDHALETAEEELLADLADEDPEPLENWLARELGLPAGSPLPYGSFERVTVAAGELLFRRDDVADAMYLVLSGRLHVYVGSGEERTRVRSMSAGSFVGEMGVYGREPRSADVEAETDAVLLRLSAEALDRLSRANPYTARALHRLLFRLQGERLRFANAEIAALHS